MAGQKSGIVIVIPLICAALVGCGTNPAQNQTTTTPPASVSSVSIDSLPKAVVEAVQKELPGATLTKAKMTADGNYYLSDVKVGKTEYNVTVSPDGKILSKKEDDD